MDVSDRSSWRGVKRSKESSRLHTSLEVDVAIIGGGITGITAAYLLRDSGKSIALLERENIGDLATGSTTGFLMETLDIDASELISKYGKEAAQLITKSHRDAVSRIEEIIRQEHIECEFTRCPAYIYARTEKQSDDLRKETGSLREVGTPVVFSTDSELPFKSCAYIKVKDQAKFHSLKYLFAIADICEQAGAQIFEHTEVSKIEKGEINTLHTKSGHQVHAKHILVATHYPLDPQPAKLRFKKAWYSTYVLEARLAKHLLPEALFEDIETPYHYARIDPQPDFDRLIIGGEDHRSDIKIDEKKSFDALETYLGEILASVPHTVTRKWKGRIVESADGLAFIGPTTRHKVFYATAYSGTGLTYGTIAAQLFADFVEGRLNPVAEIYAASRSFSLRQYLPKAIEYIREFFGAAVKNYFRWN